MESLYLQKRQSFNPDYNDFGDIYVPFWATPAGIGARIAIFFGIVFLLLFYLVGGSMSARKRFARGQKPIWGTAWMLRRRPQYPNQYPMYSQPMQPPPHNDAFGGHVPQHHMPPPAYNADQPPPAVYEPVRDGSKIAADQNYTAASDGMTGTHSASSAAATSGTTGASTGGAGTTGTSGI